MGIGKVHYQSTSTHLIQLQIWMQNHKLKCKPESRDESRERSSFLEWDDMNF